MSVNEWIVHVFLACFYAVGVAALYLSEYWLDYWPDLQREEEA